LCQITIYAIIVVNILHKLVVLREDFVTMNSFEGMVEYTVRSMYLTIHADDEDVNIDQEPNAKGKFFMIYWMLLIGRCGMVVKVKSNYQ